MRKNQGLLVVIVQLIMALQGKQLAEAAAKDALGYYKVLCEAWRVAKEGQIKGDLAADDNTDYLEIMKLNMSISDSKWQNLFDGEGEEGEWPAMEKKLEAESKKLEWGDHWARWRAARVADKAMKDDVEYQKVKQMAQHHGNVHLIRHAVAFAAEEAMHLNNALKTIGTNRDAETVTKINSALKAALCGSDAQSGYDEAKGACKETAAMKGRKSAFCTKTQAGKGIGHDILCLCADNMDDACGVGDASGTIRGGNIASGNTAKLTGKCDNFKLRLPLDSDVTAAVTALATSLAAFGTGKAIHSIGFSGAASCANDNADNCVDYTQHTGGDNKGVSKIKWVEQLETAAAEYENYKEEQRQRHVIADKLSRLKRTAIREFMLQERQTALLPPAQATTKSEIPHKSR